MTVILLIGAAGQVGQELERSLPSVGTVISIRRGQLDLTQTDQIRHLIDHHQPQIIVNAAAYTAVDQAEKEPALADAVNGVAPTVMAEAAQATGAIFIHLSTDYVFNGQHSTPYREMDAADPVNIYGRSKWAGERGIRQQCDRHLILRTAWVYGSDGKSNFVKTMLRLGAQREEIRVVCDQVGAPTWAADLAQAVTAFAANCGANMSDSSPWGTYHYTNSGVASWYDFAIAIFDIARSLGYPLQVQRVLPITTADYPTPAKRPAYSVLSLTKTTTYLGNPAPYWRHALEKMITKYIQHASL